MYCPAVVYSLLSLVCISSQFIVDIYQIDENVTPLSQYIDGFSPNFHFLHIILKMNQWSTVVWLMAVFFDFSYKQSAAWHFPDGGKNWGGYYVFNLRRSVIAVSKCTDLDKK